MSYGEIYMITNKSSNKSYVGQAKKYVGKYDKEWGTRGRWKSHVYNANHSKKDHCALLNNAIRKYGKKDFTVKKLCDCKDKEEMNQMETEYINKFNTLVPNGYNLNTGGYSGSDSQSTKEKKRVMRLGKKHSIKTKENISNGQLGNRRNKLTRKHPEDEHLPKYLGAMRKNGKIVGYQINSYPIGITEKKYFRKVFGVTSMRSLKVCLYEAYEYLEELNEKYSGIHEKIAVHKKILKSNKPAITKKTEIQLDQLPKYVFPVYHPENKNKIGYYVEGVLDHEGNPYPKKTFTSKKTNKWNLNDAKLYIKDCEIKNQDHLFKIPEKFETSRQRKYADDDNNLPKYVSVYRQKGVKIGYNIAIPYVIKPNGKKYTKKFANKKLSMQEKLNLCIKTLEEVKKKYNVTS